MEDLPSLTDPRDEFIDQFDFERACQCCCACDDESIKLAWIASGDLNFQRSGDSLVVVARDSELANG